jgi:hypothetical protein
MGARGVPDPRADGGLRTPTLSLCRRQYALMRPRTAPRHSLRRGDRGAASCRWHSDSPPLVRRAWSKVIDGCTGATGSPMPSPSLPRGSFVPFCPADLARAHNSRGMPFAGLPLLGRGSDMRRAFRTSAGNVQYGRSAGPDRGAGTCPSTSAAADARDLPVWWRDRGDQFLQLFEMAMRACVVPERSAACERRFRGAHRQQTN